MARAVLIMGGNIGDMKPRLRHAQQLINDEIGIVMHCSHVYASKAWGFTSGDDFKNQALEVDTDLTPYELLEAIHSIENRLGRDRTTEAAYKVSTGERYSSRVIDIDIVFYDDMILEDDDLTIPHPLMQERDFVLAPLSEIVPHKVHPVLGKTVKRMRKELLAGMTDGSDNCMRV